MTGIAARIVRRLRVMRVGAAVMLCASALRAQSAPLLSGRVIDASTGAALGNVEVTLSDGTRTLSATDGHFRLRALEPGPSVLQVRRPGFAMQTRNLQLVNGQSVTLMLSMTPIPVTLLAQRVTDSAPQLAAGTSVIDRAAIERAGSRDLGELLRGQQGVILVPRGGPGSPVTISIRGSSADQVLVLVDGTPINSPISGEADLSMLDPAIIERVEIIRGAQSSRYGSQALGGVILVTTRHPGRIAPQLSIGSGQWGERRLSAHTAIDGVVGDGIAAATVGAAWQQQVGNFRTAVPFERGGGMTRRDNADTRRLTLNAGGSVQRNTTTFDVRGDVFDIDRGMPGSIVQPSLAARQTQRRVGMTASLVTAPGNTAAIRGSLGVQRQSGRFADATPPFGAPYDLTQRVTSIVTSVAGDAAVQRVAVTTGAEVRRLGVTGSSIGASAPRVVSTGGAWLGVSRPLIGERWRVEMGAGGRADVGTLWSGAYFSPDLHLTMQRGAARVGTSWRSAFAAPSLGDLFFHEGVQVQANPALRPERVRGEWTASVDVNRIAIAGTHTTVGVSAFRGDIDDLILWSPNFRFVWSPDNFDVSRRGVDASMRIALPSNAIALTLTGGAVDVRYRSAVLAGQVIYRPRLSGAVTLDVIRGATDAQLALQSTGARRTVVGSEINQLPAFQLMQLRVARRLDLGQLDATLRLSVENLLDQPVAMLLDFPFPGRTWSVDVTLRPQSRLPAVRRSPVR